MTSYLAFATKEPDSDYGVEFPDLPGCITAGSTMEEAMAMAEEALAAHILFLEEEGQPVPPPTSPQRLEDIIAEANRRTAVPLWVPVDRDLFKMDRINVSLPRNLVRRIDAVADNRSRFLAEAAEKALADRGKAA